MYSDIGKLCVKMIQDPIKVMRGQCYRDIHYLGEFIITVYLNQRLHITTLIDL